MHLNMSYYLKVFIKGEKEFLVSYKEVILKHKFYADFVIEDKIILEVKSSSIIVDEHYAQVLNYLEISNLQIGLLVNFTDKSLQHKRIISSK